MIENNFTREIAVDDENLSPALGAMMGVLAMPHQYSRFVNDTMLSLNMQCPQSAHVMEK